MKKSIGILTMASAIVLSLVAFSCTQPGMPSIEDVEKNCTTELDLTKLKEKDLSGEWNNVSEYSQKDGTVSRTTSVVTIEKNNDGTYKCYIKAGSSVSMEMTSPEALSDEEIEALKAYDEADDDGSVNDVKFSVSDDKKTLKMSGTYAKDVSMGDNVSVDVMFGGEWKTNEDMTQFIQVSEYGGTTIKEVFTKR